MSKSRIVSLVAMAAAMAAVSAAYPVEVEVHNNHWRLAIEPETSTEIPGFSTAKVRVRDEAQMLRLLGNVEALAVMSSLPEGVGMSVHFPAFIPEDPVVEVEVKPEGDSAGAGDDTPQGNGDGEAPSGEAVAPTAGTAVANFAGTPEGGEAVSSTSTTTGTGDAPSTTDTPEVPKADASTPDAAAAATTTATTTTTTDTPKNKRAR